MTPLYHRIIAHAAATSADQLALTHKVWDPTPWVCDVFTGGIGSDLDLGIRDWCVETFGRESWPIHDAPAQWYHGSATVDGWTWLGFATEAQMLAFQAEWPNPEQRAPDGRT